MTLRRPTRRRRASITSLIDVIFLLLLFFMLASTFSRFAEIEIAAATEASGAAQSDDRVIRVVVEAEAVRIDGVAVRDADIAGVLGDAGAGEAASLTVSVAEDVTTQRLVDVLTTLDRVSGVGLVLAEAA